MKSLDQSVAFITGAGRGVGRAIAVALAQHGIRVAAQDISPVNLDETMRLIHSSGSEGLELVGDMSKKMQVQGMIEAARDAFGEIEILINQGTVAPQTDLLAIDEWDWDRTLGVNLKGYFLATQSIGRLMRDRRRGLILNVVIPPTRYEPAGHYPAYEISAAAIRALTRESAHELRPYEVKVLALDVIHGTDDCQTSSVKIEGHTWWQREPGKVASTVLDLCARSEQIRTGELLMIGADGGVQPAGQKLEPGK